MLEDLRAALEDARPNTYAYAVIGSTNNGGLPRRALEIEEIEAVAATARDKGHQAGYTLAQEHMRVPQERALLFASRAGETLGGLAGISTSIAALQRRREGLADVTGMESVVGSLSSAIEELEGLYDQLNEVGMHGERERDEQPGQERAPGRKMDRVG